MGRVDHALALRDILGSRIGRRFVAMFVVCALLPIAGFAGFAVDRTTSLMRDEATAALHGAAKSAGAQITMRLGRVATDLALARAFATESMLDRSLLKSLIDSRCAAAWTVRAGVVAPLFGEPGPIAPPDEGGREHLAGGRPLVQVGPGGVLVMSVALRDRDPASGLVAVRIRMARFWDGNELRGVGADVHVCDERWGTLYRSSAEAPEPGIFAQAALASPSSGTVAWRNGDEDQIARYWNVFVEPQFGCNFWVVQSRPTRQALAVSDQFAVWFSATAAMTLLLALLAGLVQIRRTIVPVMSLREATRRLAAGDLAARTGVDGSDEIGALGIAFDAMAARLQENVRRREETERELIRSRDAALAAVRAKEEFVGHISHEFRTPMTEILGAVEILSGIADGDAGARVEFSDIAVRGARRLARLVDDVLELTVDEPWTAAPTELGETIAKAVAALPDDVRGRVQVGSLPTAVVLGNDEKLRELWIRLLDNALKFSPAEAPVEVTAAAGPHEVVVEVVDRGPGIAAEHLDEVFEPFRQVGRDQMTDKANGAGLGLTLVRRIVERHGGRVEVDSQPGRGATFRVRLPALVDAPAIRV
jgi:two-component system OmpR family sensor kinase